MFQSNINNDRSPAMGSVIIECFDSLVSTRICISVTMRTGIGHSSR